MQTGQTFGRRGLDRVQSQARPVAKPAPDDQDDEALEAFREAAKADWAEHRRARPRPWKRHPGMTALAVMAVVFFLIAVLPLHLSRTVIEWVRGGLGVGGLFGFGAKRLFGKKDAS